MILYWQFNHHLNHKSLGNSPLNIVYVLIIINNQTIKMQCPYLKDIRFSKIFQIQAKNDQLDSVGQIYNKIMQDDVEENNDIESKMQFKNIICKKNLPITIIANNTQHFQPSELIQQRLSEIEIRQMQFSSENFSSQSSLNINIPNNKTYQEHTMSEIPNYTNYNKNTFAQSNIQDGFFTCKVKLDSHVYQCQIKKYEVFFVKPEKKYHIDLMRYKIDLSQTDYGLILAVNAEIRFQFRIHTSEGKKIQSCIKYWINKLPESIKFDCNSLKLEIQCLNFSKLEKIGDTFDLLLFKNKSFISQVQRFFTNSQFDHIAMILRSSNQQLFIFQCTNPFGVGIYPLRSLQKIDCRKYFDKICYKRFTKERKSNQIELLEKFVKASIGKKYRFDPIYLIQQQQKSAEQEPTFFCSDLIARALQQVGFVDKSIPSFKFLPKHFCDSENFGNLKNIYSDSIELYIPQTYI